MDTAPISARMYVTDENNSPDCLLDHPTVITGPPWELIGQFLTSEMDSSRSWLFQHLPRLLRACAEGGRSEYVGGTEGFDLEVRGGVVKLDTNYCDPPASCEVPLEAFRELFDRWRAFLKAYERAKALKES